jgi:acyl-CoA reductase-like NAD-dependent aldehyde dehydrogenase
VDAVSLTGSERAGWSARAICGSRGIPLQAELGGNNAAVVWDAADLFQAVRAAAEGAFGFAGQRCTANRRLIVPRASVGQVLAILGQSMPQAPSLISPESKARVAALLRRCGGATIEGPAGPGPDTHPAVVVLAEEADGEIVQEESFGPVLVVQPADDFEHAVRLCNGVRQGLVAALFTRDPERRDRFLETAQAGVLKVNRSTVDAGVEAPFGGWKSSGSGPPEHGVANLHFYARMQAVYE